MLFADISAPTEVLGAAISAGVTAVATSCADTGVSALGAVCDELGMVGLSREAAEASQNKLLMKEAFVANDVRTAAYQVVSSQEELDRALPALGFPVVIKATDLQGSLGVVIAGNVDEAADGFRHAMGLTQRDSVLVEQFIDGVEFGAQALVYDGEVVFVLPHGDEVFMARTAVPVGHYAPLGFGDATVRVAEEEVRKAIRAVGIDNAAVNADLILRGDEVYVIEITGRVGANGLPEMVSGYFGIDYYSTLVRLALGEDPTVPWKTGTVTSRPTAVRMLKAPDLHGRIERIEFVNQPSPKMNCALFKAEGDVMDGFQDSGDCVGQIVVSGETLDECLAELDAVERELKIVVGPNDA